MLTMSAAIALSLAITTSTPAVRIDHAEQESLVRILVEGDEAITYQYGKQFALPHYWPVRSPSGKPLTTQHPDPYPHHRSVWIADRVQGVVGPDVDFYHCWKNLREEGNPAAGYRHFIRHQQFGKVAVEERTAIVEASLQWIVNDVTPVLDEHRTLRVTGLGNREFLIDLQWTLSASHGDVRFLSDDVHYAWPYLRMHPQFSGDGGGVITNDQGGTGQAGTNGKDACWVDYSASVEGITEGIAVFLPGDASPRRWLTREYGTFGPRRAASESGTRFTLKDGQSLSGRVAMLVHQGDVDSGRVADRYGVFLKSNRQDE